MNKLCEFKDNHSDDLPRGHSLKYTFVHKVFLPRSLKNDPIRKIATDGNSKLTQILMKTWCKSKQSTVGFYFIQKIISAQKMSTNVFHV